MVKHRSIVPAPSGARPRIISRPDLFSRLELEALYPALLTRSAETTDSSEMLMQIETLIAICGLLLDDQSALSAAERVDYQRELLLDAMKLGVHLTH